MWQNYTTAKVEKILIPIKFQLSFICISEVYEGKWRVSPQDSSHQIWYQYLLNFGCGVVLSHFHATFTPFYTNQGRFWNGSPFLLWSEAKNISWCQISCFLSAVYHGDKNDQNVIFLPFTPFTPLTPKLWSNDENTLQKW